MNMASVKKLIVKDLDLQKKMIAAYVAAGILGLAIFSYPHVYAFYIGALILLTVMVALGCHTIVTTVIMEKKEQVMPFIITLPLSPLEFYFAKLIANLVLIMTFWTVFVAAVTFVIFSTHIPNGLFPFLFLVCCFVLVNYSVVLCVAMLTESEGWSIFSMVIVNLMINPFIMWLAQNPRVYQHFDSAVMVWTPFETTTLLALLAFSAGTVVFTLLKLSVKRSFI